MSSLLNDRIRRDIGDDVYIHVGLLTDSGVLGLGDSVNIDILPLDYSILDDIDYKYPAGDNYFAYVSRGCTNKCKFCAVPILEPQFCMTNNINKQNETIKELYGEKRNLLLLDNNILSFSEEELNKVIEDIYKLGFDKETKYYNELPFIAYIKKLHSYNRQSTAFNNILNETVSYLRDKVTLRKTKLYQQRFDEILNYIELSDNKYLAILQNEDEIIEILSQYHHPAGCKRKIDFNQGIDARQLTEEKMKMLSKIPIEPFRLAFDSIYYADIYIRAMKLAYKYGVNNFSNYILYNYEDKPEELWERLKINIELSKKLNVKIFSFPMKYAPINKTDRQYVGRHWNKKFLKNIYAILNVTKGIVADGESFFYRAFGRNIEEFFEILSMPKDFVIYRNYYEDNGLAFEWKKKFNSLSKYERDELLLVLSENAVTYNRSIIEILRFYDTKKVGQYSMVIANEGISFFTA